MGFSPFLHGNINGANISNYEEGNVNLMCGLKNEDAFGDENDLWEWVKTNKENNRNNVYNTHGDKIKKKVKFEDKNFMRNINEDNIELNSCTDDIDSDE